MRTLKFISLFVLVFALIAPAFSTGYTVGMTPTRVPGYGTLMTGGRTMVGAADSLFFNLKPITPQSGLRDTSLGVLGIYTSSHLGNDSVRLKVLFQNSDDGYTWTSYTIGDTSYWSTSSTSGNFALKSITVGWPSFGGLHPFQRVTVVGITRNSTYNVVRASWFRRNY